MGASEASAELVVLEAWGGLTEPEVSVPQEE